MCFDLKQAIVRFLKSGHALETRSPDQRTSGVVRPAMISAPYSPSASPTSIHPINLRGTERTKDSRTPRIFGDNGVSAMSTHIMKSLHSAIFSHYKDEWDACGFELEIIAGFMETGYVEREDP